MKRDDDDDDEPSTTASIADVTERIALTQKSTHRVMLLLYPRDGAIVVPLRPGVALVVGRDPTADVVVTDDSLSRHHARFKLAGDELLVEDMGSTNGTRVGDRRVERAVLKVGDEVHLGTVPASVHVLTGGSAPPGTEAHDTLRAIVDLDMARARLFHRSFALITVRTQQRGGRVSRFCQRVQAMLRPVDRVALYGLEIIDVLAAEVSGEEAAALARRIVSSVPGVPLLCGVAAFPGAAASMEALFEAAHAAATAASPDEPVQVASSLGTRLISPGAPAGRASAGSDIVRSAATRALFETAGRLARTKIPVLIVGETGTGKEVLARAVHEASPRRDKPMICVNCGAIPKDLVESTLFGYERGAFTGAQQSKQGVFEAAAGGTVLLDELGELPPAAQVALLRVLESKRVTRVGSTKEIEVDVRIIAATHRDLESMIKTGAFREDLFYRLNAMMLSLPPLRDRRDDIAPLARHFLEQANLEHERFLADFEPAALAALHAHRWPGNVRELRNAVDHAVALATGNLVGVEDLPARIRAGVGEAAGVTGAEAAGAGASAAPREREGGELTGSYADCMVRLEVRLLTDALRRTGWNQTKAAILLKMPLRTLQHRIKRLGLQKPDEPKKT